MNQTHEPSKARRQALGVLVSAVLAGVAPLIVTPVQAQDALGFPGRPVTVLTPFSAGSGPDAVLRMVAEKLSARWNQRVIVENRPGAAGFIAIDAAKRAAPDGYTLLQLDSEQLGALPHLYKQRNYRPFDLFEPIAPFFRTPFLAVVPAESPVTSMAALLAAARASPDSVTYGSWGIGSPAHLGGVALESEMGVTMRHVPYKEMSQLFLGVASKDVNWSFGSVGSSLGAYKSGKVRYLAVAAAHRLKQLPDVPTVSESGGPKGFTLDSFAVLLAPKGIDPKIAAKVHTDVLRALAEPDILARFDTFAFEALNWAPAQIRQQAEQKGTGYGDLIRRASISLD